ncbi:MAG: TldD/PmbA family protein [Deltaproteobacteria bacterium]|nr:TldD/PmbA family protein [Deltaproteobacteria bacterium]
MFEKLKKILSKVDADYADIRYEEKFDTTVTFNGKALTGLGSNTTDGYVLRVLKNGGFASVSFTLADDADAAVRNAQDSAILVGKNNPEPVRLAAAVVVQDIYKPELTEDPRRISIEEKMALTRQYNDISIGHDKIVSTDTSYMDQVREKYFMSTEGARIREDLVTNLLRMRITAAAGNDIQTTMLGIGGSDGFAGIRNQEAQFENKTALAVDLLSAPPVAGGGHNVILNPMLAAVFTHEAFGHFSEADLIEDSPSMRERMAIGAKLGSEFLHITDDPTRLHQLGHYKYDDEGMAARPTRLMRNGVLVGRLHSRRTAACFGEPITGHCVAEDYRYAPIVRMGAIFIEPGDESFDSLAARLGDGYYFVDSLGGQTSGENFTFTSQCGYRIRGGKKAELVRGTGISGNLYETLGNIVGVANDLTFDKIGGCGKIQVNLRSCNGAPHILINDVVAGGA